MKRIVLVRHATAVKHGAAETDFDRSLRKRGRREAASQAKLVRRITGAPSLMVSSPANRAIETAEIFASVLGYPSQDIEQRDDLYDGVTGRTFIAVIKELDDAAASVMFFGHDPVFSDFAHVLVPPFSVRMPKCGVFAAVAAVTSWRLIEPGLTLEYFIRPTD